MSYEKQTWNKYDDLKTEEENIENGAVVTDNRMNHMESGIGDNDANLASHLADKNNPHKVTAAQVGLGNVQNFGLATEDEAKQGISNAKYMTPSLTQAVLSANINSIAYANSLDGTDGFTTVYPNLNLLDGTRDFSGNWISLNGWTTDGTYKGLTVKKRTGKGTGFYKVFTAPADGTYTFSSYLKSSGNGGNITRWVNTNGVDGVGTVTLTSNFDWMIDTFSASLKAGDKVFVRYEITSDGTGLDIWNAGHKWEQGSTATPYMPSASEATTADWPKYVGFSNTVKTNKSASDYTWFPVKDSELTNKVDSHVNNKANPHSVTASQVGAYSKQEIDAKLSKAVMADDSGKVSIGTLDSNTLTVQGTKIYPNTKDGVWTVERLFDNEYRLTTVMSVSEAVAYAWNSLFISSPITHTAIPSGYIELSFTSSMANTSSLMWCAPDTNTSFRIVSGEKSQGASRKVIVTVYATK
ncbi:hypothetical protein RZO31_12610 [Lactococcus lactis]|uniref:Uncharacterized protein n=1 Tax=Lactococcus lactis TaxID=1358 RepID=A0AAE4NU38_9LACT|nr:hypothetical protein [Lactococcus lactis]MDV2633690.1 hypothetical protein [Lactococcus lactis]